MQSHGCRALLGTRQLLAVASWVFHKLVLGARLMGPSTDTDISVLEQLEQQYPWITWREPLRVKVPGVPMRYACRVCIALSGSTAARVKDQFKCEEETRQHITAVHVRLP